MLATSIFSLCNKIEIITNSWCRIIIRHNYAVMAEDLMVNYTTTGDKQLLTKNGEVWMTYPNAPTNIKFCHKSINDHNQVLCDASGDRDNEFEEIDRVVIGLKPVGISYTSDFAELSKRVDEYRRKGFLVSYINNKFSPERYNVTVSPKGKLGDYFDMDTLAKDYIRNGLAIQADTIKLYKRKEFSAFHDGKFDVAYHQMEIVGLILGYPIENTIALIKRDLL